MKAQRHAALANESYCVAMSAQAIACKCANKSALAAGILKKMNWKFESLGATGTCIYATKWTRQRPGACHLADVVVASN